jgi:hypothetical protein
VSRPGLQERGDPAGVPVVYLHGTPGTPTGRPGDADLGGVRLIAAWYPVRRRRSPRYRPADAGLDALDDELESWWYRAAG